MSGGGGDSVHYDSGIAAVAAFCTTGTTITLVGLALERYSFLDWLITMQ